HPLAVVLSCIDSRTPAELICDLGMGDIFSVRIAGNVVSRKVLGSVEYGCAVAGAKLILVMGHTGCGAVSAAVDLACSSGTVAEVTGCAHLEHIVHEIQQLTDPLECQGVQQLPPSERGAFVNAVARRNVARVVARILDETHTLSTLARDGRAGIGGSRSSARCTTLPPETCNTCPPPRKTPREPPHPPCTLPRPWAEVSLTLHTFRPARGATVNTIHTSDSQGTCVLEGRMNLA